MHKCLDVFDHKNKAITMSNIYSPIEHHSSAVMNDDQQIRTQLTKHNTKSCIQIMAPVLTLSKIVAIYYDPVHRPCRCNITFFYCICVLILFIEESFRLFFIYNQNDGFNFKMLKVLMHAYFLQACLGNIIFVFSVTPGIRKFFKEYDMYQS